MRTEHGLRFSHNPVSNESVVLFVADLLITTWFYCSFDRMSSALGDTAPGPIDLQPFETPAVLSLSRLEAPSGARKQTYKKSSGPQCDVNHRERYPFNLQHNMLRQGTLAEAKIVEARKRELELLVSISLLNNTGLEL